MRVAQHDQTLLLKEAPLLRRDFCLSVALKRYLVQLFVVDFARPVRDLRHRGKYLQAAKTLQIFHRVERRVHLFG